MIEGSKINLRHINKNDLPALLPLLNDQNARGEYLPLRLTTLADFEKRLSTDGDSNGEMERFLIVDREDKLLGIIFHFKSGPYFNAREIGYVLFTVSDRRSGVMTEAVRLLSEYLFGATLINRLEIKMDTRNIGSEKVAIKCGYQKEGVARGANFVRGKHVDMSIYALLRNEWELAS